MNAFEQRRLTKTVPPSAHGAMAFAGRQPVDPWSDLSATEYAEVMDPASYDPDAAHRYTVEDLRRAVGLDSIQTVDR